jgi:uncharacterized damage-inducible protein DinB
MTRTDLLGLFTYDAWANREALASLPPAAAAAPKAVKLMAHVAATAELWLSRVRSEPAPLPVWPDLSLDECGRVLARGAASWNAYLEAAGDAGMAREIAYTNSRGDTYRNLVSDIAMHVVFHAHYHRGKIAALVRAAGHTPAYTDFIHAVRTHATGTQEIRQ